MSTQGVVLGTKRTCPSCGARFYDLMRAPLVCPKCQMTFLAETILPSKGEHGGGMKSVVENIGSADDLGFHDVELVDIEGVDVDEPDAAEIVAVDLGDDTALLEEDDAFLDEGKGSVSGIIGTVKPSSSDEG